VNGVLVNLMSARYTTSSWEIPTEQRPDLFSRGIAEGVGYVFVEGVDVDPHAAQLRVEGGQEGRSVGLREVSVLECRRTCRRSLSLQDLSC